jgi:hypothetical protein
VLRQTVKAIPYHTPPRAKSARFNVKIQKLLRPALPAPDQRKVCLLNFCHGIIVVCSQQYLPSFDTLIRDVLPIHCANATKIAQ